MNGEVRQFNDWKSVLDYKAHSLYSQIAQIQNELSGSDAEEIEQICKPYYDLLESLYSEDYPLANAIENSDLVVRLAGVGIDDSPRVSVIASYFGKVRKQVTNIAKALADLDVGSRKRIKEFDLSLTAFAKGSLVLGFSLPTLEDLEVNHQPSLLGEEEPFYKAAMEAMKTLGIVSHIVTTEESLESLSEAIPDPKIRDVTLSAVRDLAPSGRQGISTVSLAGKEIGRFEEGALTKEIKQTVKEALEHPVESDEIAIFFGDVREIDLDAHRFDLRHIENEEINEVRCVYSKEYSDKEASKWINKNVKVEGKVERDINKKARLMEIISIDLLS